MWRPDRKVPDPEPTDDGAMNALSEIAQWVRFADTKAGLLAAGLGVILAGTVAQAATIVDAVASGGALGALTAVLFALWSASALTLVWFLMSAIGPRTSTSGPTINRFAWPSLPGIPVADLTQHVSGTTRDADAWRQVVDLSTVAASKYQACGRAVLAFMIVVVVTAAMVALAHVAVR
ncbi:hypothetical protein SAMN05192575_109176 [Nocardioides alpinus]|uniref:Pycsar effector protein domain-containing protein n=2 Tax=Nocardioides alpinus TaxID=748909 RepID=A0A1I1ALH2_9ACTN|nr:hypothetical protein SAMN05192575_109176 [Nocardioides alpinus]